MKKILNLFIASLVCLVLNQSMVLASSHREAPLISNDPLADNTDVYAFRSPCDSSKIVLIANYIPFELPQGGYIIDTPGLLELGIIVIEKQEQSHFFPDMRAMRNQ